MGNGVNPIPEGFHTVTPYMTIKDAASAIEFYKSSVRGDGDFSLGGPGWAHPARGGRYRRLADHAHR
jgi:uncharacterized glyoxalase superfamily protein PhnB